MVVQRKWDASTFDLMLHRHDLTDTQWVALQPHLPPPRGFGGRRRINDRAFLNAVLWLLRTDAPWRDLPPCYGNWSSIATRFYRWCRQGVWQHILEQRQRLADQRQTIDWTMHYVDTTVVRAHHHAACSRGDQGRQALGRSRGGFSTKIHVKCEGNGKPLAILLTGGERHEMMGFVPLLNAGRVKRQGAGRPRHRPKRLVGDRGYSNHKARRELSRRGITPVIPPKAGQAQPWRYDRLAYRERNRVERMILWMKRFRRVATRYEKQAVHYGAFVTFAAALQWLPVRHAQER